MAIAASRSATDDMRHAFDSKLLTGLKKIFRKIVRNRLRYFAIDENVNFASYNDEIFLTISLERKFNSTFNALISGKKRKFFDEGRGLSQFWYKMPIYTTLKAKTGTGTYFHQFSLSEGLSTTNKILFLFAVCLFLSRVLKSSGKNFSFLGTSHEESS